MSVIQPGSVNTHTHTHTQRERERERQSTRSTLRLMRMCVCVRALQRNTSHTRTCLCVLARGSRTSSSRCLSPFFTTVFVSFSLSLFSLSPLSVAALHSPFPVVAPAAPRSLPMRLVLSESICCCVTRYFPLTHHSLSSVPCIFSSLRFEPAHSHVLLLLFPPFTCLPLGEGKRHHHHHQPETRFRFLLLLVPLSFSSSSSSSSFFLTSLSHQSRSRGVL